MASNVELLTVEMNTQLANAQVRNALLQTTFKGLNENSMRQACLEGLMRGFDFKDFLKKNVYAIPFGQNGYSLITSIDYARKVGMRSGVVGVSEPAYVDDESGKCLTCTITVKRKINDYIGDYTATVYFSEYTTGKNQWATKPRTMIAKVAEMHALRKACPEELSQSYAEEEVREPINVVSEEVDMDVSEYEEKLIATIDMEELKAVWSNIPPKAKKLLESLKEELKKSRENPNLSK